MEEKIREALLELDPADDSVWTRDGRPNMHALRAALSDDTVTRDMVDAALPGFNREFASELPDEGENDETEAPDDESSDEDDETEAPDEPEKAAAQLAHGIEGFRKKIAEIDAAVQMLHAERAKLTAACDKLIIQRDAQQPSQNDAYRQYLERQHQLRIERAGRARQLRQLGVDVRGVDDKLRGRRNSKRRRLQLDATGVRGAVIGGSKE